MVKKNALYVHLNKESLEKLINNESIMKEIITPIGALNIIIIPEED